MDILINELTLYSKIDTNRIPYNFTTISAKAYFDDCAEDLSVELEAKGVLFHYKNEISNMIANEVKKLGLETEILDRTFGEWDLFIELCVNKTKKLINK